MKPAVHSSSSTAGSGAGSGAGSASASVETFDVVIVGSGFSGLCSAIKLKQEGARSFVVLERAGEIGGTWRDNHYPGCACDVPSHLYSFSFEQNPGWSRMFAPQGEILEYLRRCADKYGVRPHVRFNSEVTLLEFDERAGTWRVQTAAGTTFRARYVILGIGALSQPAFPDLVGMERFEGKTFHSAKWDHSYSLAGKRVGVIGTGASAIQLVPQIAPVVDQLALFQRTPPWVIPKIDRPFTPETQALFRRMPLLQRLYRAWIYCVMEARGVGFTVDPRLLRAVEAIGRYWIRRQIHDPALRAKVTPNYAAGCKRVLIANDYYPALNRPNVQVVTDGIREITARGVRTVDGIEHELDALVYATGFRVTDMLTPMRVYGRGGVELNAAWSEGAAAYMGTTVSGFPNLFTLMGPNTGLGHNSMIFMIESQVDYLLRYIRTVDARGARFADVLPDAQSAFNDRLQKRLRHTVWATGCKSWYLDKNGRNTTLWPGFTVEFWLRTRRLHTADYDFLSPQP